MGFWRFADEQSQAGMAVILPLYDPALGWLAGALAVLAGFALFATLERVRSSPTRASRGAWLIGGSVTMSIGVWGTQNIALLSVTLPTDYKYDPAIGFAALLPCIAGCAATLHVLASRSPSGPRLHAAALSLAAGIAGSHYTLMEALVGDLVLAYDPYLFFQSLALGYGFSLTAIYASCAWARLQRFRWAGWLGGSVLIGVAVLANHFSAMAGTTFLDDPAILSTTIAVVPEATTAVVAGCVMFIVVAFWLGSVIDGRLAEANDAVRGSNARNRAIVDTMLDAHMVADIDGTISAFNPAAEATFGWSAAEIIGRNGIELFNWPQGHERHTWLIEGDRLSRLPAARRRWVYAQGGQRKDGSTFPIELAISPFEVGGTQYYSCTVRDLSERWESETRLRRLATAIEQAGDAIAILDAAHCIQYVNPQYERQTGFSRDDVIGLQPGSGASDRSVYVDLWNTVDRGRVWNGQVRTRRRDGRLIDEELTVTPVLDSRGAVSGFVAVMRDITRRLEAELDRRRLAEALQYTTDSIEILDAQGCIVYVNAAFEKNNGQRLAEIRGCRPEALTDFGGSAEAYDDMIRTAYRGGRPWSGTLKSVNQLGEEREEDITVSPMRDERGQVHGFVIVKRDTTDRRRLEAQAQQRQKLESMGQMADSIARELARPVREISDHLQALDRSARSVDDLIGELMVLAQSQGPVAPAVIAGCLQSADAEYHRLEFGRAVTQASNSLQRLSGIVGAMRDISYSSPEMTGVDLNRALQSTITVSHIDWRDTAEVRTTFDPTLPPVRCVAGDVSLVAMSMLSAAAQAIGEVNRSGIRGKGVITVSTQRVADWAEIRISHNGRGVPPEARQALFCPATGTDRRAGGLALAHDVIVRRHKGTIAIESDGRKGASFVVRLPIDPATPATSGSAVA